MDSDIVISEKKLESLIYNHLSGAVICEEFNCLLDSELEYMFVCRQLDLGPYGIADIVTFTIDASSNPMIEIFELKKGCIDYKALTQVFRYKRGIEVFSEKIGIEIEPVRCNLIGGYISTECGFDIAISSIDGLSVFTYDIDPNSGIILKEDTDGIRYADNKVPSKSSSIFSCWDYITHDCHSEWHNYTIRQKI